MVTNLTPAELDLLERLDAKPELRPFFFQKVKGLKWFEPLAARGYFSAEFNPPPEPAKQEGFVSVPFWPAVEYLVSIADELGTNDELARKTLEIIRNVTEYARRGKYSNYRTWWQFSKILPQLPLSIITTDDLALVDYWLEDPYERTLVAQELGKGWLRPLLNEGDAHSRAISLRLLELLYTLKFTEGDHPKAVLRIDSYWARQISNKVASEVGAKLGEPGVRVLRLQLERFLEHFRNDSWSSIWRPAIEDHEQNIRSDDPEDVVIEFFRNALVGYAKSSPSSAQYVVKEIIGGKFETSARVAIFVVDEVYETIGSLVDDILNENYFGTNFRHEVWRLLHRHYVAFPSFRKLRVLEVIGKMIVYENDHVVDEGATAYKKASWLSAIKDCGSEEKEAYGKAVERAGAVPDHPDFSSYMSSGWVGHKSPYSKEELLALKTSELVSRVASYSDSPVKRDVFQPVDGEGLRQTLRQVVKADPVRFQSELQSFADLALEYVCEVIEAYSELWKENAQLPWLEIWTRLLEFCWTVVTSGKVWDEERDRVAEGASDRGLRSVVVAISRLIESGTRSDEHVLPDPCLDQCRKLLSLFLQHEKGSEFTVTTDAVHIAANSPRGQCLEAFINLTLRYCRLADKENDSHVSTWEGFRRAYDDELSRASESECEFSALVVCYLPNFLYMSRVWVLENLTKIFDEKDHKKWVCAMQGYAFVSRVHEEIYRHLRSTGQFVRALDDELLKERIKEKVVQNIAVGYTAGFDDFEHTDSLILRLLGRRCVSEINHLVWFIWTLGRKDTSKIARKLFDLWDRILNAIELRERDGRLVASQLCLWVDLVGNVEPQSLALILKVAPYADENHHSYSLLENIARISAEQPMEAYQIWGALLEHSRADFPDESIRVALANIVKDQTVGIRRAKEIVSRYLLVGYEKPSEILRTIEEQMKTNK